MGEVSVPGPDQVLARTFVALADTLVTDFDVIAFLQMLCERSVELLGVDAAGLLVTDQRGNLRLMAASSEQSRLLELFQLQNEQGPCLESFNSGHVVHCADLAGPEGRRWPQFAEQARECGFAAVSALPMRLRADVIRALNLFRAVPGPLTPEKVALGQALAEVATIGLLQERAVSQAQTLVEQLQTALNSRVVIEQAKGVLAQWHGWSMEQAFTALRAYARDHNPKLTGLAGAVVAKSATRVREDPRPADRRARNNTAPPTVPTPDPHPRILTTSAAHEAGSPLERSVTAASACIENPRQLNTRPHQYRTPLRNDHEPQS
ncbi:GAF and ANTAR domain-containing protein [Bailinhaonella thermotolerans]|uniref:ANTAR domain-containing protein n=1 Tax=Bailinhaonella thermotolerans TaxID=1070861 RepID=A0A3A4A583_9ACTN|nr:GAF and ANTAR domain-containing protein [Bailinhaonella thermotolerans]RJL23996.1 ANTAR domain-containing protein [Bailinhaonella thermotolerans]